MELKGKVSRSIWISVSLAEKIAKKAQREGKSNAAVIKEILAEYFKEEDLKATKEK